MKLTKSMLGNHLVTVSTTALLLLSQGALAAAGSYSSNAVPPTITNKGTTYTTNFNIVGSTPPAAAKLGSVGYTWSYSYVPSGLTVLLCHAATNLCANVSSSPNGSTTAFANFSASSKFYMTARVSGTGTILPAYGQNSQVRVNWSY